MDEYGSLTDEEVLVWNIAVGVSAVQPDYPTAIAAFDAFMAEFFIDEEAAEDAE